jgi:hypothetical protein
MSLAKQPPRRFKARVEPRYPALLVSALAAAACTPSAGPTTDGPTIAADPVAKKPKKKPTVDEPEGKPRFAIDDDELDLHEVACKGDCPAPFESAVYKKDIAQVQARLDWCVKAAVRRGDEVPRSGGTLLADVDAKGRTSNARFEPPVSLPDGLQRCVLGLVADAKLTPPAHGTSVSARAPIAATKE